MCYATPLGLAAGLLRDPGFTGFKNPGLKCGIPLGFTTVSIKRFRENNMLSLEARAEGLKGEIFLEITGGLEILVNCNIYGYSSYPEYLEVLHP